MYTDPSNVRDNVVKLRFNDSEAALIDAVVNYTGQQKAAFLRDLVLEAAQRALAGDIALGGGDSEGPQHALKLA